MEEWRPVADFEGIYEVSDLGNIRSLDRIMPSGRWGSIRRKGGPIASKISRTGRRYIGLRANGLRTWKAVHDLVCEAFHGTRPSHRHEVAHFPDPDPLNNRAANLRWVIAPSRHGDHADEEGALFGAERYAARLNVQDYAEIRRLYRRGRPGSPGNQAELADRFGVVPSYIRSIANRKDRSSNI